MRARATVAVALAVLFTVSIGCSKDEAADDIVVGKPEVATPTTLPPVPAKPPLPEPNLGATSPRPEPGPAIGLGPANGFPFRAPIPFESEYENPTGLLRILIVGSDARPGEDIRRTRADSIHLLTINADSQQGTVLGLPRDSWVEVPGYGKQKITMALALGGPDLLSRTVSDLTGIPVDYYVITGFNGLRRMVDTLDGVDVLVRRRMNDKASGARFEPGWHRFNGNEALAYARNRNDVEYGDFSRSMHQGDVILAALAKMRAEVGDDAGVRKWIDVLLRDVSLDVPLRDLPRLGAFARRLDPERLENVVAPGRVGNAGRQSVVFLGAEAEALFDDLRPDGVRGVAKPPPSTSTTSTTEPTTSPPDVPFIEPTTTTVAD